MISFGTFTAFLVVSICPSHIFADADCSPANVADVFASTFFNNIVSAHKSDAVFKWRLSSRVAADTIYEENLRVFQDLEFRSAGHIASKAAAAVSLVDPFTLEEYYEKVAITVGVFFDEKFLLDCDNAIQTATDYVEKEESIFQSLDQHDVLESYVEAILEGLEELLEEFGYSKADNEGNWEELVDIFFREYNE